MKPLNEREWKKAFLKVAGFFLAGFIIAITLGFVTLNVPRYAERNSNKELERLKENLKFQEDVFAPNVGQATLLLARIPLSREQKENLTVLNQDIGAILSQTKNQVAEDESWETKMYNDVIKSLSDLQVAYQDQLNLTEQVAKLHDLNAQLQQCISERNQLQVQLAALQSGKGGGGGEGGEAECAQCLKELKEAQQQLRHCNLENRALKQEVEKYRQN